jgi:hypothetical protein
MDPSGNHAGDLIHLHEILRANDYWIWCISTLVESGMHWFSRRPYQTGTYLDFGRTGWPHAYYGLRW